MPKYNFIVRMAGKNGAMSQSISGYHPSETMDELAAHLNDNDFIVVEQFTMVQNEEKALGPTILNQRMIGKVRPWQDRQPGSYGGEF